MCNCWFTALCAFRNVPPQFGKWIKVPTALLSEARNTFLAVQKARTRAEADRDRRVLLGFTTADAEMAAAVAAQVQIIREAKLKKRQDDLKEAERKAAKDASADIQATDTPANATSEAEERDSSPGPLEQLSLIHI